MKTLKLAAAAVSALAISAGAALSAETTLRIQTHFSPETLSGQMTGNTAGGGADIQRFGIG